MSCLQVQLQVHHVSNSVFSLIVLILGFLSSDVKIRNLDAPSTNDANFVLCVVEVSGGSFRIRYIHFKNEQNIDTTEQELDNFAKAKYSFQTKSCLVFIFSSS
jgi:hypothetical protein